MIECPATTEVADPEKIKGIDKLLKYGRHLQSCELSKQPYLSSSNSYWVCTCGFSEALNCGLCSKKGFVVNLPMPKGGYFTGHCPVCGEI